MLRLAAKFLVREWRAGELRVLLSSLIVAIACLASIGFITERLQKAMETQASELLGGDIAITATTPIPKLWLAKARQLGLKTAMTVEFSSMLVAADKMQLATVKAVSETYPLLGKLRLGEDPTREVVSGPPRGEIWLEPRLFSALGLNEQTQAQLGQASFITSQLLRYEPDYSISWRNIAPRLLMNYADLASTHVLQPGSRAEYRLLATGSPHNLQQYIAWLKPQLTRNQNLLDSKTDSSRLYNTVRQITQILRLAALLCLMLTGIAIASTTQRYTKRHYTTCSLLRCLGLKQKQILALFAYSLIAIGVLGACIGCILGFLFQQLLAKLLHPILQLALPPVTFQPAAMAAAAGLFLLASFSLAPLINLQQVSPSSVLRREQVKNSIWGNLTYAIGYSGTLLLIILYTQDLKLSLAIVSCVVLTTLLLWATAKLLLVITTVIRPRIAMPWRYGLANLSRHSKSSQYQSIAFGLIILAITLLLLIQHDVLATWQQRLSPGTPNYFAINIMADEAAAVEKWLQQNDISHADLYPMVRGRLTALNGQAILATHSKALQRELNLSWRQNAIAHNVLQQGQWWKANDTTAWVSIEASLAEAIGANLGDRLTFTLGSETINASIKNIRAVDWYSMQPNFFIVFSPGVLQNLPVTYLTSFYLPSQKQLLANQLVQQFPSISLIDIAQVVQQLQQVMHQASWILYYLLAFASVISLLILCATLQASLDLRLYEGAIMRTLGMSRKQLQLSLATEFILLGTMAGVIGILGAEMGSFILAKTLLNIQFHFNLLLLAVILILSILLISLAGIWASRAIIRQAPSSLLQEYR
jgi:putative ABC transport system permease protein